MANHWLTPEEQRTWRAFLAAIRAMTQQLDRDLQRTAGMPLAYYEILVRLSEAPGRSMRMSELAACSMCSRSRLSHAVARLEAANWVRREECPADGRGALAVLTDEGLATLKRAAPGHVAGVRAQLFDRLSPQQILQLRDISDALNKPAS